jgi:hypothetical protein
LEGEIEKRLLPPSHGLDSPNDIIPDDSEDNDVSLPVRGNYDKSKNIEVNLEANMAIEITDHSEFV